MSEPSYDDLADTITANLRTMRGMGDNVKFMTQAIEGLCAVIGILTLMFVITALYTLKGRG